jgi:hypothetical protein
VNAQLDDRVSPIINDRRFILTKSAINIIESRLNYINDSEYVVSTAYNLMELMDIIVNESHTDTVFLPLFNFDYRNFMNAIIDMAIEFYPGFDPILINIKKKEYSEIPEECINIGRGVLFFGFFKFLEKKNLLFKFAKKDDGKNRTNGYCRPSRLLLTALCNLSYPNGFPENTQELLKERPKENRLYDIYDSVSEIITPQKFTDWITKFFNFHKSSWAHLVTIYNKKLDEKQEVNLIHELELLKKESKTAEEILELNNIEITTNASAYIYIKYLIVDFEYFSIYAAQVNGTRKYKPLLQELDFESKSLKYGFEELIEDVSKVVKDYKKNTELYFNDKIKSKYSIDAFSKSIFTFRKEREIVKQFYFSRIVTTHIEYLENFRCFLWNNSDFKKKVNDNKATFPASKSFKDIQFFIVRKIREYLELLKDFPYPAISNAVLGIENNLVLNELTEIEAGRWQKINVGERTDWEKEYIKRIKKKKKEKNVETLPLTSGLAQAGV